jgi:hypothetical protein
MGSCSDAHCPGRSWVPPALVCLVTPKSMSLGVPFNYPVQLIPLHLLPYRSSRQCEFVFILLFFCNEGVSIHIPLKKKKLCKNMKGTEHNVLLCFVFQETNDLCSAFPFLYPIIGLPSINTSILLNKYYLNYIV